MLRANRDARGQEIGCICMTAGETLALSLSSSLSLSLSSGLTVTLSSSLSLSMSSFSTKLLGTTFGRHTLRLVARLLHRFPAGPRSFTLRLPHGLANVGIEVRVAHVDMEVLHLFTEVLHLVVIRLHLLVEVFGVEVEAEVTLMLAN